MELLSKAPNVIATLNGHTQNELASHGTSNAFKTPLSLVACMYRVFRVYADRWNKSNRREPRLICKPVCLKSAYLMISTRGRSGREVGFVRKQMIFSTLCH